MILRCLRTKPSVCGVFTENKKHPLRSAWSRSDSKGTSPQATKKAHPKPDVLKPFDLSIFHRRYKRHPINIDFCHYDHLFLEISAFNCIDSLTQTSFTVNRKSGFSRQPLVDEAPLAIKAKAACTESKRRRYQSLFLQTSARGHSKQRGERAEQTSRPKRTIR